MYIPTEEEFLSLGFFLKGVTWNLECSGFDVCFNTYYSWFMCHKYHDPVDIFPQTKEDVLTLIRLFTPPQEVKNG